MVCVRDSPNADYSCQVSGGNSPGLSLTSTSDILLPTAKAPGPHQGLSLCAGSSCDERLGGISPQPMQADVSPSSYQHVRPPLGSYRVTETQRQRSRLFRAYISRTHACKFHIHGKVSINGKQEISDKNVEYVHRWTAIYRKAILSKFYQLQDWWEKNPTPITLLSLTTYQDLKYRQNDDSPRLSIEEGFDTLKKGWRWLSVWLRKWYPDIEYVHIMEPHRSGYPHMHVILFGDLPVSAQEDIRRLWSEKYKAGSFEHGVDFSIRSPDNGIKSIRNYLMKYIQKTLINGKTGSKFENEINNWTPGELLFNATIKAHKWRLWGASLFLSKVMAYKKSEIVDYEWIYTELIDENGDYHVTGGEKPNADKNIESVAQAPEADPDDLSPEDPVTMALWSNRYQARYRAMQSRQESIWGPAGPPVPS